MATRVPRITCEAALQDATPAAERAQILDAIAKEPHGFATLVKLRADALARGRTSHAAERQLRDALRAQVGGGRVALQQVTWSSPARTVEHVLVDDAVHPSSDWAAAKQRVSGPRRACFGLFHPGMPEVPLAFVLVALTHSVPRAVAPVVRGVDSSLPEPQTHAIFYGITSPHRGLAGIDLGHSLIRQTAQAISRQHPAVATFATLSPMPRFRAWVEAEVLLRPDAVARVLQMRGRGWAPFQASVRQSHPAVVDTAAWLSEMLHASAPAGHDDLVKEFLVAAASEYLLGARRPDTPAAVDPVAHFHLRNGAALLCIHPAGGAGPRAWNESYGVMASYLYVLGETAAARHAYLESGQATVASLASGGVHRSISMSGAGTFVIRQISAPATTAIAGDSSASSRL